MGNFASNATKMTMVSRLKMTSPVIYSFAQLNPVEGPESVERETLVTVQKIRFIMGPA